MTVTIEVSEKQLYALRAVALVEGWSVEAWFQKIVDREVGSEPHRGHTKLDVGCWRNMVPPHPPRKSTRIAGICCAGLRKTSEAIPSLTVGARCELSRTHTARQNPDCKGVDRGARPYG